VMLTADLNPADEQSSAYAAAVKLNANAKAQTREIGSRLFKGFKEFAHLRNSHKGRRGENVRSQFHSHRALSLVEKALHFF